jgi:endonuclease/exonuclease/phosphatase (EEP) superfamily protein YafD
LVEQGRVAEAQPRLDPLDQHAAEHVRPVVVVRDLNSAARARGELLAVAASPSSVASRSMPAML